MLETFVFNCFVVILCYHYSYDKTAKEDFMIEIICLKLFCFLCCVIIILIAAVVKSICSVFNCIGFYSVL